ncbi:hypothetical protein L3Y34_013965 [Caenorhabditis briggsae]|uniref:F-box C protein n=1 Tax=Caenorhabditis briggsae TaxID=6238 RepID=A0AAE9DPA6_CAEBR|nr:hypothetical protein L3Y34_013965 [Caenorhabditis briggsae]
MANSEMLFDNMQVVIEYLESNFRLQLASRLPPIRAAEKSTPLIIKRLVLGQSMITVDSISYKLKQLKEYDEEIPLLIKKEHELEHDVDQYGFPISPYDILLDGDLKIYGTIKPKPFVEDEKWVKEMVETAPIEEVDQIECEWEKKEFLRTMEFLKSKLLQYEYKRNNRKIVTDSFLELSTSRCQARILKEDRQKPYNGTTEQFSNIPTIYEGMKKLLERLFGNRKVAWKVDLLELKTSVLRWIKSGSLPIVSNLSMQHIDKVNMDVINSVVHKSSFPLKTFEFTVKDDYAGNFNHSIITTSELLKIANPFHCPTQHHKLRNSRVNLPKMNIEFFDFERWIVHWLRNRRPIGTIYIYKKVKGAPPYLLEQIRKRPELIEETEKSVTLKINETSALHVYFKPKTDGNWGPGTAEISVIPRENVD